MELSPEEINDILATCDSYETSLGEREEEALTAAFRKWRDVIGPEAFLKAIMPFLLAHEESLRRIPNHPALKLIDRWRTENGSG